MRFTAACLLALSIPLPLQAVEVIAHRGDPIAAPENTLPAIRAALAAAPEWIELDLQVSADGRVVLMHDRTVDRTTDGSGAVAALTLDQLRALDAGAWFGEGFAGVPVPTLEDALDAIPPDGPGVILEIKSGPETVDAVHAIVSDRGLLHRTLLKSFDVAVLDRARTLDPDWSRLYVFLGRLPFGFGIDDGLTRRDLLGEDVTWVQVHRLFLSRSFVEDAHERGLKVVAWDVHSERAIHRAIERGVDAIETDRPGLVREIRDGM